VSFALSFVGFPAAGGPLSYSPVPWDSDLFGMPFYELRCTGTAEEVTGALPAWQDAIRQQGLPALAFTRIQPSDVRLAEVLSASGFYPAETTLDISLPLKRFTSIRTNTPARARLRRAEAADLPVLTAIADEAFTTDRFHLDPHLPAHLSSRRYVQWVERGFRDGDHLFAYESLGEAGAPSAGAPGGIMGFYLIRDEPGGEVDLSLAGVSPRYHRAGVGVLMYDAMLEMCSQLGYRVASTSVSTSNRDVVNLFMRFGFTIRAANLTMHLFLNP
jgi:ribosomal protein S18 acetylase RimI-like enzyme